MKELLNQLFAHQQLSKDQAKNVLLQIGKGQHSESSKAALLTVFNMRPISVHELSGFREALMELSVKIDLSAYDPIDIVGTGGDSKNTFNISTLSAFVVAASGVKVAKHGNYSVSSICGSSNLLEYFGYQFTTDESELRRQLEQNNICFLHAPLFHPSMKHIAPVRKSLGVKTFFNMLGPLVNPANVTKQCTGVYSLNLLRIYQHLFDEEQNKSYQIVNTLDGYDEISLTSKFKLVSNNAQRILGPEDLGLSYFKAEDILAGHNIEESAKIFYTILEGKGTQAQNEVIYANSALAIQCDQPEISLQDAVQLAKESLMSKKALEIFNKAMNK